MFGSAVPKISPSLAQAIEEAILLGGAREISEVLARICDTPDFPETLRHGLEALFFFRAHYGKGGDGEPSDPVARKRTVELEALWGKELIDTLEFYTEKSNFLPLNAQE